MCTKSVNRKWRKNQSARKVHKKFKNDTKGETGSDFANIVINIPNQIDIMKDRIDSESSPEPNEMKQKEVSLDQLSIIDDSSGSSAEDKALSDSCTVKKQETEEDTGVVIVT